MRQLFSILAIALILPLQALAGSAFISTGSQYPSQVLKNQFGETSINSMINGGSNQLDCNFIVDSTNVNGYGVSSFHGPACAKLYMHTSATPIAGNPNPPVGYILVQLAKNYAGYLTSITGFTSALSGSSINVTSGLTLHNPYVITAVGTTTTAQWQTLGVPAGVTPAVGVSFFAITASVSSGTGTVQAPLASPLALFADVIGDSNTAVSGTLGAQVIIRTLAATNSTTTTPIATNPADGTVIRLRFSMLPLPSQLK